MAKEPKVYTFSLKKKELFAVVAGILVTYVMVFILGYSLGKESVPPQSFEVSSTYEAPSEEKVVIGEGQEEVPPIVTEKKQKEPSLNTPSVNVSTAKEIPLEIPIKPIKQPASPSRPTYVRFFVQAAAFSKQKLALALKRSLVEKGYKVEIIKVGQLYKVLVGPFSSEDEAKKVKRKLVRDEKIYGYIVKY